MMIRTHDGGYINLDNVTEFSFRAWSSDKPHEYVMDYVAGGEDRSVTVSVSDAEKIKEAIEGPLVMPAQPGYMELMYFPKDPKDKGADDFVDRWPVIAWRLDLDMGFHCSITIWTYPDEFARSEEMAILCPDGRVVRPGGSVWPNEDDWREEMRKDSEKEKAKIVPLKR